MRSRDIGRVVHELESLEEECEWRVTIEEKKSQRTLSQNALLWQLYADILRKGGTLLDGWEKEDLHNLMLGEHFGWERLEGMGRVRVRPLRRSSRLTKTEFAEFIDFVVRYMANKGIVLETP
jgi:hypothetical protein